KITKAKLAANCCVNTVVCVKKPGPIDEVAIKKAAPSNTLLLTFFFLLTLPSFCVASVLGFFISNLQLTDCIYSNIVLIQSFIYIFCKAQCMCSVTMNTNGICSQRNFCFLLRNYVPFCHHF